MKPDGCAGVYKKDCFSLLSSHPVEYFRRGIPLLDRDNLGLVLLLCPTGPFSPEACVRGQHTPPCCMGTLSWPSWLFCWQTIRTVSRLSDGSSCPIVLYGDFNSVPWSPLYNFVRESSLEYDGIHICKMLMGVSPTCLYRTEAQAMATMISESRPTIEHSLRLTSAYSHYLKEDGRPEITTWRLHESGLRCRIAAKKLLLKETNKKP
ncbi:protein angel homolog 2-like [Salmo trutta]|uniref:protein angel homolog 2-like n=1 Tax=Salmo trutta TaxID=8032 RepID=UPI001130AB4C|nr:protein angel homolog 2-like [Salmo trutta]